MLWVIHSFLEKDVKYEQNMKPLLIQAEWVCFNNNKTKNPTQHIALKFELERTGFIHFLLQYSFMKRVWSPSDENNFISWFDEANKFWVEFISSKYRAEVCCVLWSMMAEVRLVGKINTGEGRSEARAFKQIGVELQGFLLPLKENLRCKLSRSYSVMLCYVFPAISLSPLQFSHLFFVIGLLGFWVFFNGIGIR